MLDFSLIWVKHPVTVHEKKKNMVNGRDLFCNPGSILTSHLKLINPLQTTIKVILSLTAKSGQGWLDISVPYNTITLYIISKKYDLAVK